MFGMFNRSRDERTAADEKLLADCNKVLASRRPAPMALYWARLRKGEAERRLAAIRKVIASEAAERATMVRKAPKDNHGSRFDPTTW